MQSGYRLILPSDTSTDLDASQGVKRCVCEEYIQIVVLPLVEVLDKVVAVPVVHSCVRYKFQQYNMLRKSLSECA